MYVYLKIWHYFVMTKKLARNVFYQENIIIGEKKNYYGGGVDRLVYYRKVNKRTIDAFNFFFSYRDFFGPGYTKKGRKRFTFLSCDFFLPGIRIRSFF